MSALFLRELEQVFGWLLAASWQASALALLVLGLQGVLRGWLNPRWRYALWLLVLVRLLLPVAPESTLSLFQFAPRAPASFVVPVTEPLFDQGATPTISTGVETEITEIAVPEHVFSLYSLLAVGWLAGVCVLLVLTWQVNRRFARQVAQSPELTDPALRELLAAAQEELGMSRTIRLIKSGQVQSPAIMGLFHPTLLLPADVREKFDTTELRLIFLHELAHLKRGDVIAQMVIAVLQILHWFNPVLWFAFRRMRIDREPATDALVLSRAGEGEKERYGLMLIKLLEHFNQRHSLPTLVGILEDKDQFKRRFSLIARFTRGAYGWSLLGVLIIGVLAVACLTKKVTASPDPAPVPVAETKPAASLDELKEKSIQPGMIRVGLKVFEIGEDEYQANKEEIDTEVQRGATTKLAQLKSIDLITDPYAVIKAGEQGILEAVRIFPFPTKFEKGPDGKVSPTDFDKRKVGVRFAFTPTNKDGKIQVTGKLEITTFEGFIQKTSSTTSPTFHTTEAYVYEELEKGETKGIFLPGLKYELDGNSNKLRRLFFILSTDAAKAVTQESQAGAGAMPQIAAGTSSDTAPISAASDPEQLPVPPHTPLNKAIAADKEDEVKVLLDHGAEIYINDVGDALAYGKKPIVKLLWDHGARYCSELSYVISQDTPVGDVKKLLDGGMSANPQEDRTITPLGVAAQRGNLEVAKLLVENGANPHPVDSILNPLLPAARLENPKMVSFLLASGAKPDFQSVALAISSYPASADGTQQPGADIVVSDLVHFLGPPQITEDQTAFFLISAADKKSPELLKLLLQDGLKPGSKRNQGSEQGKTAIEIVREEYARSKTDEPYNADLKPMLDILEAADKGAGAKTASTDAGVPAAAKVQIGIECKVAEIKDDVYQANREMVDDAVKKGDIVYLLSLKGVSMMSPPNVTTLPGQKATVEIIREFPYPTEFENPKTVTENVGASKVTVNIPATPTGFTTKDVGVTVEVMPSFNQEKIILNGKFTTTEFEGFTESNMKAPLPSFTTKETLFLESLDDKQTHAIWIPGARFDGQKVPDYLASGKLSPPPNSDKMRMILFLTVRQAK